MNSFATSLWLLAYSLQLEIPLFNFGVAPERLLATGGRQATNRLEAES